MARISVDYIKPGMITSRPVESSRRNMILDKGVELKEKHKRILKAWGVFQVDIEGEEEDSKEDWMEVIKQNPALLKKCNALEERFSDVLHNEVMVEILRIAKKQLINGNKTITKHY